MDAAISDSTKRGGSVTIFSAARVRVRRGFGSYNTAHMMCNKIHVALGNVKFKQLMGYVEADETLVGGTGVKGNPSSSVL